MAARYRRPAAAPERAPESAPSKPEAELKQAVKEKAEADKKADGFSFFDIIRVVGGIILLSGGLSYLSTSGTSMTWGYNPWWTRAREWKVVFKRPLYLTDEELKAYDGTDPTKPIYLALNGTIYDVSANPGTYGPGGSYHFFAGRDAARAFLTGCFQEDQTPDLRGVEQMYMPLDPWEKPPPENSSPEEEAKKKAKEVDARRKLNALSKAELKNRHAQELRKARKQVKEGLEHWHAMFRGDKGKAYFKVGEVKREKDWLKKLPKRKLCDQAEKGRPVRKYDEQG